MNVNASTVSGKTYAAAPIAAVYELPAVPIKGRPSAEVRRLADSLFEKIEQSASYRPHGRDRQRKQWRRLVHAGVSAVHAGGSVRYSRANKNCPKSFKRLIQCADEAGVFHHYRSRPTNNDGAKQSRLLPTAEFCRHMPRDPWEIEPTTTPQYVRMRSRDDKQPLFFDPALPIAVETRRKLESVNAVNAGCEITYRPAHGLYTVQTRPILYALFHENWGHGRIFIERGGSGKSLTKKERSTIRFDGEPSVEIDFSAMHPRLAYHLRGLECHDDPYAFWGDDTTKAQRELAKLVLNTALNAKSRSAAVGACFDAIRLKTKEGWKEGNTRKRSLKLRKALCDTIGISPQSPDYFKEARRFLERTYDLAIEHHKLIAPDFAADAGASLMRVESSIALDVLCHFANKGIPVMGVHDSFIVPESHGDELREVMVECYRAKLGFPPVVKTICWERRSRHPWPLPESEAA